MNKAITRLIIWACVAVILIAMLVVGLTSNWLSNFSGKIPLGGFTYADADSYSIGNATLPANTQINEIEINWISGSIDVSTGGNQVVIKESDGLEQKNQLRYKVERGKLTIQFRESGYLASSMGNKNLTLVLPESLAKLTTFSAEVVSANINVKDIASGSFRVDSVSGALRCTNLTADRARVNTVSGLIDISGAITDAEMDTVSGSVTLVTSVILRSAEIDTVSGGVRLMLPENNGFTVDYDSASGDFNSTFAFTKSGDKYIAGDGMSDFEIDTVSGALFIDKAMLAS